MNRRLFWGAIILVANSAYLFATGDPVLFYFANVMLHLVLGLALLVPFCRWWWRERANRAIFGSGALLLLSAACALWLWRIDNTTGNRPWLVAHIALALLGLAALIVALAEHRRKRWWRLAAAGLPAAMAAAVAALWWQNTHPDPRYQFSNPPAPLTMAGEAMGGESGPFFPSSVRTTHGGTVDSKVYMGSESCSRSGCHPNIYEQWNSSAHHFSSFNNQWYRKSIEYMQEVAGIQASKWCGGCHDPAILQSGMMDRPIEEIVHTREAQAGLSCTACHMISSVASSMGQGDYEITVPPLHDLATSENPVLTKIHDTLVKLDPEPHRRTFIKPFFENENSAEFCATCHKVHLDVPVNNYRWIRGFNSYDNWQASGVSGFGARSFYYPPEPRNCLDCHMPMVESDDAGNHDGLIRSHRFPGANTALPIANRDEKQLKVVTDFLQAGQVTVDIFAMTEAQPIATADGTPMTLEGPALATSFAIGEEQGMAVGRGGRIAGEAETLFAPIDRIPATVRRGESMRVDVVVRTRGVGHFFPGGTVDAFEVWVELKATDETGQVLFWSGMADEDSPVEPGAAFYRALLIDAHGNPINKRNAFANRAVVYVKLIPPGAGDTVRFRLAIPEHAGDTITLEARLNYRKFGWFNTHWAYAGVPDPAQEGAEFGPDFDDREFVFTGDLSDVSGELKEIPRLPIVVMAEDTATLQVAEAGAVLPDMSEAVERPSIDRERWNDYGIGLLRQGDLRGARRAFRRVTELEPEYVDGWVNLGRVALAEGDLDAAREVLTKALAIDPELARAHYFTGVVDKELGEYEAALEHFRRAAAHYPRDRVVRNAIGRIYFLQRDFARAITEFGVVLDIDPEDLTAHYNLMLSHRGAGDLESSNLHRQYYERFKADESSQVLTRDYLKANPHDNNRRQAIFEHKTVPLDEIPQNRAGGAETVTAGG
ncbi:MAG: tetratricopeptide repeat protein [Acidobacteria bacterium]|nr:tetratricopeptide repeat protein [Acidobacteriota bacterium]